MRILDLFSGIGGFSLGLERAGMETVAFCETDPYARKVLKKHWPDVPIYEDIKELTGEQIKKEIGTIDIICGGFPCQPYSIAGKRKGAEDDRALWPEMLRIIQEVKPRWIIGENVAGFIRLGLDNCLSDLARARYETVQFIIPACAVNAKHRRERVWIVANSIGKRQGGTYWENIGNDKPERQKQNISQWHKVGGNIGNCGSRSTTEEPGANHWEIEPSMGRVAHGIPKRVDRLRCLGNAIVPQVVQGIGEAIMEIEKRGNNY